ncbi:hypothetical protein D187_008174 [Cystobacter fuscus DSM 2262]|uniref:Uncharacterized protein n=1 Tax=Cystobacter fuscus (strain ATCC 25194 / DSM 2262 / NBRC 100088 / M29) TaxID=1242864 RepID=S9Q3M7_CYSF2|nr:hypothetical protein D187_008174 [Cystobacter fuscus DSM 2262]
MTHALILPDPTVPRTDGQGVNASAHASAASIQMMPARFAGGEMDPYFQTWRRPLTSERVARSGNPWHGMRRRRGLPTTIDRMRSTRRPSSTSRHSMSTPAARTRGSLGMHRAPPGPRTHPARARARTARAGVARPSPLPREGWG